MHTITSRYSASRQFVARLLTLAMAIPGISAQAATISLDFTSIPDGTPVAANNPYAGLVQFSGVADYRYTDTRTQPNTESHVLVEDGKIQSGALVMGLPVWPVHPPLPLQGPPGEYLNRVVSTLTGTFLEPVCGITFTTYVPAYFVGYQYEGMDASGTSFHGAGQSTTGIRISDTTYTTVLDAPDGGYFTKIAFLNWSFFDPEFKVYDISLRTACVPEPSTLIDRIVLGLFLAAAPLVRRRIA